MADGDRRAFLAPPGPQPAVLGREIRVLGPARRLRGFDEPRAQVGAALAGLAAAPLAGTLVIPGAIPAQAARCAAVGKRLLSGPISARMISAPRRATPGIVSSWASAPSKGRRRS